MAKYDPLFEKLSRSDQASVCLTFDDIGKLVGGLPASAYNHRPWWANEVGGSHVQAHSWTRAGYQVSEVVLGKSVLFSRLDG
ncbi:hypothetical protein BH09PAT4_BH09PAT4_09030 [soil metagenome]